MIDTTREIGLDYIKDIYTDILVVGGGPAGIGASVGAAKTGKKTLLIEKNGFLGGMATAAAVSTICGAYSADKKERIIGGVLDEWMDELEHLGGLKAGVDFGRHRADLCDHHLLKYAADKLILKYDIDLMFHTLLIGAKKKGENIEYVLIANKEGVFRVFAKKYIDTTGDADMAKKVGAPYVIGNEKGQTQAATAVFLMGDVDLEKAGQVSRENLIDTIKQSIANHEYDFQRSEGLYMPTANGNAVICNMNWVSNFSPLNADELTRAEIEGRKQSLAYSNFLKEKIQGFQSSYLVEFATQIGIRETRRIIGEFVLTEDSVMNGEQYEDAICFGAWPVEYHDAQHNKTIKTYLKQNYQIPYRTLIPKKVNNLWVAGRSISTTHFANASTRVMAPSTALGQAAGVAAAISIDQKVNQYDVNISMLQRELRGQGAIL